MIGLEVIFLFYLLEASFMNAGGKYNFEKKSKFFTQYVWRYFL
jgi:hypothetical protein